MLNSFAKTRHLGFAFGHHIATLGHSGRVSLYMYSFENQPLYPETHMEPKNGPWNFGNHHFRVPCQDSIVLVCSFLVLSTFEVQVVITTIANHWFCSYILALLRMCQLL